MTLRVLDSLLQRTVILCVLRFRNRMVTIYADKTNVYYILLHNFIFVQTIQCGLFIVTTKCRKSDYPQLISKVTSLTYYNEGCTIVPTRSAITTVFAPSTNALNTTVSVYESVEVGRFSVGILLTAPMTKLTTVTARDVDISLFSKASSNGCK